MKGWEGGEDVLEMAPQDVGVAQSLLSSGSGHVQVLYKTCTSRICCMFSEIVGLGLSFRVFDFEIFY